MNFEELLIVTGMNNKSIHVEIITPVRKGEVYKRGYVAGFKPGLFGGGYSSKWFFSKFFI